MKRCFFQTKIYDYETLYEAEQHEREMSKRGWRSKLQQNGFTVFKNGQDSFPYSVEYFKEL